MLSGTTPATGSFVKTATAHIPLRHSSSIAEVKCTDTCDFGKVSIRFVGFEPCRVVGKTTLGTSNILASDRVDGR